ncbi:hypothetical protein BCON_0332g00060 [Botryotinia convoluta]|uniref:Uncharacterized protein n=1 Tax=Botryotinia convoluta TaxID=54673 RepID=A0A4Z1HB56_9HELO|nr:hypothetical protein BCON_0332g00060 [Botryotinia convoluta]
MVNGASNEKETAKNAQQSKREWYKQELTGCRTITSASWGRPRMVRARTRPVLIYNSIKAEDVLFLKRSMRFVGMVFLEFKEEQSMIPNPGWNEIVEVSGFGGLNGLDWQGVE